MFPKQITASTKVYIPNMRPTNQPKHISKTNPIQFHRPNLNPNQQSHQGGAPSYNAVAYQPCNNVNNAVVYQPSANVVYQPSVVNNAIASGVANGVANAVANAVTYQPCHAVKSHH